MSQLFVEAEQWNDGAYTSSDVYDNAPAKTHCRKTCKQEIEHLRAVALELERKLKVINETHSRYDTGDSNSFWKCVSTQLLEQQQKSAMLSYFSAAKRNITKAIDLP
ncbi:hypothetical protein DVH05_027668 [Phytophthora capsici]|nr:hypothetical protein DVH05_027668 [Phytophthora capsici]